MKANVGTEQYKLVFTPNDIKRYEDYGRFYRSVAYYLCTDDIANVVIGYNSRPREMINKVLCKLQNKEIIIQPAVLISIIEQTIQLMIRFSENPAKHYLVDACIHFAVLNPQKFLEKSKQIEEDSQIVMSLEKSPSTTTNVNLRIKRVSEILNS